MPTWRDYLSQSYPGLRGCKQWWVPLSWANLPIQIPHHETLFLWSSQVPGYHRPVLITPSQDTKQLGTALTPQNLLELFKLATPKPAHLAWPSPSCRNPNEGSTHASPSILPPPDQPWWFACVACHSMFPSLGISEYNKLSLQWQCLLMCWSCHMQIIIKPTFKNTT